jgi:hypothetical protein
MPAEAATKGCRRCRSEMGWRISDEERWRLPITCGNVRAPALVKSIHFFAGDFTGAHLRSRGVTSRANHRSRTCARSDRGERSRELDSSDCTEALPHRMVNFTKNPPYCGNGEPAGIGWRGCCKGVSRVFVPLARRDGENARTRMKRLILCHRSFSIAIWHPSCLPLIESAHKVRV